MGVQVAEGMLILRMRWQAVGGDTLLGSAKLKTKMSVGLKSFPLNFGVDLEQNGKGGRDENVEMMNMKSQTLGVFE